MGKFQRIRLLICSLVGSHVFPRWKKEPIDNNSALFRNVHFNDVSKSDRMPAPAAFKDCELSCNWNKYSTPQHTRELISKQYRLGTREFKDSNKYYVCSLSVSTINNLNISQIILHDPSQLFPRVVGFPNNRSHSLVKGEKENNISEKSKVKIREILARNSKWEIFDESLWKIQRQIK